MVLAAAAATRSPAAPLPPPTEYEVKAAFLLNFARFVEWPPGELQPPVVAVLGDDPFGAVLDETFGARDGGTAAWQVRRLTRLEDGVRSGILFISRSEEDRLPSILARLRGAPVLTVSDIPRFAERGGIIGLRLEQRKVRFDIAPGPAQESGLKLSSQLLKLARIVPAAEAP
jgi:hypothetical protein